MECLTRRARLAQDRSKPTDRLLFHGCNNAAAAGLPNGSVAVWCYSVANKSTRACEYQVFVADRCASCPTSCE